MEFLVFSEQPVKKEEERTKLKINNSKIIQISQQILLINNNKGYNKEQIKMYLQVIIIILSKIITIIRYKQLVKLINKPSVIRTIGWQHLLDLLLVLLLKYPE